MDETNEGARWFAANLRRAREAAGVTQGELVRWVCHDLNRPFSQQTYSKIETGTQQPLLDVAQSLARNLGTDVETLSRPPAEARAKLEVLHLVREVREARGAAESSAGRFWERRARLRDVVAVIGEDVAGPEAAEALALKLDLEGY
jgi:transcriptional regulator with XRE-family HTH domain